MRRTDEQRREDEQIETLRTECPVFQMISPTENGFIYEPDEVRLSDDGLFVEWRTIVWRNGRDGYGTIDGCLDAFLKLREADSREVVAFVKRWGPLDISPVKEAQILNGHCGPYSESWEAESVSVYGKRARQFYAAMSLARQLRDNLPTQVRDWHRATLERSDSRIWAWEHWPKNPKPPSEEIQARMRSEGNPWLAENYPAQPSTEAQRAEFALLLTEYFFKSAYAIPVMRWDLPSHATPKPTIGIDYYAFSRWKDMGMHGPKPSRLFAYLTFQLMECLSSADGWHRCQNEKCGNYYKPKRNQRCYCSPGCADEGRLATDRRRKRMKKISG